MTYGRAFSSAKVERRPRSDAAPSEICGGDALRIFLLQERPAAPERDQGFFVVADRGKVLCDLVICRSLDLFKIQFAPLNATISSA
jgi:hypothetical protein